MAVKVFQYSGRFVFLAFAILISGCATGARTGSMVVPVTADTLIDESSPLHHAIRIGTVTGGKETGGLFATSQISNENFRKAFEESLSLATMTATREPRYLINVDIIDIHQPVAGFALTVTAKIHYTVIGSSDQMVKLDEAFVTPYTANYSDAFDSNVRLRIADEGAVRENIKAAIAKLVAASGPGQPLSD
jgi:hypothetical protein